MFRWAFDQLYGYDKFNHKWIESRPGEISKFTTRIDHYQISLIRQKFYEWINLDCKNMIKNKVEHVKLCRLKIYHAFEALLCSGMRIGEFCNIDWSKSPAHRFSNSQIDSSVRAEIVINTEKTCKQREIYVPLACYRFFVEHKIVMKSKMIEEGFRMFNRWANFDFYWSAHSLRRTLATMMSELNINISAIALALGNTPRTVLTHYIISSIRNVDATDIANCSMNGTLIKTGNMFLNKDWMQVKNQNNQLEYFMNMHAKTFCKRLDKN
jgi:integrase